MTKDSTRATWLQGIPPVWNDKQKHLIALRNSVIGWGVVAGFAFVGWLATGFDLNADEKSAEVGIVLVSIVLVGWVWIAVVGKLDDAVSACFDDEDAGRGQALARVAVLIVLAVALLASVDNYFF